jgi:soluble lytic murein transglycosylase-like protein
VQAGESFWSIAHEQGVSIRALASASGRSATSVLHPGDRLSVPSGQSDTGSVPARLLRSGRISMRPTFVEWASRNGIDPALLQAVCYLESGWQPQVVSSTGAIGVCQLMPDAIAFAEQLIGTDLDPRDPADNIRLGARTLRWLLVQTDGNTRQALAAYYQGLTSLRRSGPYPETVQYVNAVQALAERF